MVACNYYRPVAKNATSQPSQRENRFSSGYLKDKMKQETEYEAIANADLDEDDLSDILRKSTNVGQPAKDTTKTKVPTFAILRSLPGYAIGDTLRNEDKILCCSKEATSLAMNNMLPNDCAFVLRSDGSYTYAIFNGHANGDGSMSFRVNERGHSKPIHASHFSTTVKVPMLRHREHTPRARGIVRHQHSRSLASVHDGTATRKDRAPTCQARKNRAPMSSSLPPIKISWEAESKTKESSAGLFSAHKRGGRISQNLASGRHNRKAGARVHPALSPPASAVTVTKIEVKTEDGKTETVPIYKPGMDVLYKGPTCVVSARILGVNLSHSLLEPSYTIRLMDGRETQCTSEPK